MAKITKENARAMQAKGAKAQGKAHKENRMLRDEILKRMNAKDWDELAEGIIERAKEDTKAAEFLRDTIGQKPAERMQVEQADITIDFSDLPKSENSEQ